MASHRAAQDAAKSFNYPDTITSVSYQLRKAYTHLLWDYEQVYFFRVRPVSRPLLSSLVI
jgi:hypothetical protein